MARLAVLMSSNNLEGTMSLHFGKAEWVMIVDPPSRIADFVQNQGSNGSGTADLLMRRGCTDVIVVDIGDRALARLQSANIRVWAVPGQITGGEALCRFAEGGIPRITGVPENAGHSQRRGCCCCGEGIAKEPGGCCR